MYPGDDGSGAEETGISNAWPAGMQMFRTYMRGWSSKSQRLPSDQSYLLLYCVIFSFLCIKWAITALFTVFKASTAQARLLNSDYFCLRFSCLPSCHIYKKDKNGCFILDFFGSDLSKMDQTWSNLIKLDFSQIKKCYYNKLPHLQKG